MQIMKISGYGVKFRYEDFVEPTPGSWLKKQMKKQELEAGGRDWPIKMIETDGKTLEQTLVDTAPFGGNRCNSNSNFRLWDQKDDFVTSCVTLCSVL